MRGIYIGADTGRTASSRNTNKTDNYKRKATVYYSNNKGVPVGRRSSNRDLMNVCEASGTNQFRKSVAVFPKLESTCISTHEDISHKALLTVCMSNENDSSHETVLSRQFQVKMKFQPLPLYQNRLSQIFA